MSQWSDIVGVLGVFFVLIAYLLLQLHLLQPKHLSYSLLNLLGSSLILFSLFYSWNLSAALIEIAWIVISAFGMLRAWRLTTG